ncbi:MAG: VOC family protein [Caldilineaceae bacterium]
MIVSSIDSDQAVSVSLQPAPGAIVGNDGTESASGWHKDRWGFSWQITPLYLLDLTTSPDPDRAQRGFEAIRIMTRIDI